MSVEEYKNIMKKKGCSCAQIVFSYFAKDFGIEEDKALRISKAFGGGMMKEDKCGCVTAAYMALGLFYNDKVELKEKLREFDKRFLEIANSDVCFDIKNSNNIDCGDLIVDTINIIKDITKGE